jgi:myo-inositol-1-phosphate synthase
MTRGFFEKGLRENHIAISNSMIYAYAALKLGVPYVNGAPHTCMICLHCWKIGKEKQCSGCRQGFQDRSNIDKTFSLPA